MLLIKMKICIATSVYHLRKTRPLDYYLMPAKHLIEDFADSDIDVFLFTNIPDSFSVNSKNIKIIHKEPDDFAMDIWGDLDWRTKYKNALASRDEKRFEEKNVPELIAIWLGKMTMMEIASQESDCVLWQDSGIRMGRVFGKDFSKYSKCYANPNRYCKFISKLFNSYPTVFMKCDGYINPYHGIDMEKYDHQNIKYHIRGGFIFARSNEISQLKTDFKQHWLKLINNNDYGTEENPLTLCHWQRPKSTILCYDEWLSFLNIGNLEQQIKQMLF